MCKPCAQTDYLMQFLEHPLPFDTDMPALGSETVVPRTVPRRHVEPAGHLRTSLNQGTPLRPVPSAYRADLLTRQAMERGGRLDRFARFRTGTRR